jgi:hypothetical protein
MAVNDRLRGLWGKVVVAFFKALSKPLPEENMPTPRTASVWSQLKLNTFIM